MLSIELKEDSAEKLAAIAGKPTKHYLFAAELNQMVEAINDLSSNPAFTEFITYLAPELDGTDFSAPANQEWKIKGVNYTNPAAVEHVITLASSGLKKFVLFVANSDNTIEMINGTESANPEVPPVPADTLFYAMYLVTDSLVGEEIPPVLGTNYKTKAENGDAIYSLGSFEYLSGTEASYNRIWSADTGMIKAISVSAGNPNVYPGKKYTIKNELASPLTIKHQDTTLSGSNYKKFWFFSGLDLILQPGESAKFHYSQGRFEFVSSSKLSEKTLQDFYFPISRTSINRSATGNFMAKNSISLSGPFTSDTGQTNHLLLGPSGANSHFVAPFKMELKDIFMDWNDTNAFQISIWKTAFGGGSAVEFFYRSVSGTQSINESNLSTGVTINKNDRISIFISDTGSGTAWTQIHLKFKELL
ncbi:hypothetical protein [Flavobacterium suncheonense]|uniref:Uncharacterized protein n=1 Tax=Flavobacterium suncheonense GH29-5 = DSM 17707 TaxID=1121899 RepID=A0A0A2ME80_9FLAO|nr:hypothetical protein [Flavobacterium suncheonense]KGO89728.1 hypothetical protein Q764_05905 [Flavobacterium suncheonense GH29-5 = DSM 17707]